MKVKVFVHPNSKNPRIKKDEYQMLHIYVSSPAIEGKANQDAIKSLSELFNVPKSYIRLLSSEKYRYKIFDITDREK